MYKQFLSMASRAIAGVVMLFAVSLPSHATLLGDTVTGCVSTNSTGFTCEDSSINFFSFNVGPLAAVVGPGTEFTRVLSPGGTAERTLTADLTGDQVTIAVDGTNSTFTGGGNAANIWQFADLDWIGTSGSVTGLSLIGTTDFTILSTSFTADSVTIETDNINFSLLNGNVFSATFQIETTHTAISAPPVGLLLGFVLAGVAGCRSTRRR